MSDNINEVEERLRIQKESLDRYINNTEPKLIFKPWFFNSQ